MSGQPPRKILIVGEAPGGGHQSGRTRDRVSELAGRPWEEWADWTNLLDEWPGSGHGKGSAWNATAARRRAETLDLSGYDVVVVLGRRVAGVLIPGGAGFPFFREIEHRSTRMVVIPHTSGIVRSWNDPTVVARASTVLRALAQSCPKRKETGMAKAKDKKRVTGRDAAIATLRAAEKPLTPQQVAEIVIAAKVVPDLAAIGTTPPDYRLAAPIYREAKAGRFYRRVGSSRPAKFTVRANAPESDPDLVATLKARIAKKGIPSEVG